MSTIGMRLKHLRTIHRYTLDQVGELIGATKQTLYKYENDIITNIPVDKIESLARLYQVKPAYIMGWESDPTLQDEPTTLAAHHEGDEWTKEELEDIELFKELLRLKKKSRKQGE